MAGTPHIKRCPGCGGIIQTGADEWGHQRKPSQFCNDDCRDAYRKTSKRNVCPECAGPIYAKGDTRTQGRPKRFCSEKCKNTFDSRRESRAVQLYDLMMGKRREQEAPDWDKIQRTINRLRDQWDREDYRPALGERQKTWYDWQRLIPEDLLAEDIPKPEPVYIPNPDVERIKGAWLAAKDALNAQPKPPASPENQAATEPHPLKSKPSVFALKRSPIVVAKRDRTKSR